MLPTSEMVKRARQQLEKMYEMSAFVYADVSKQDEDTGIVTSKPKNTGIYPCRISYKTSTTQSIVLFTYPDAKIPKGSRIAVSHNEGMTWYKAASTPAKYDTHQEIQLELLEKR